MVLEDGQMDAALCYCCKADIPYAEAKTFLENRLLNGSLPEMIARLHRTTSEARSCLAVAQDFLVEWNVATWIEHRNVRDGVAPGYQHVFDEMESRHRCIVEAHRRHQIGKARSKTQWVRRFARRWGGTYTSLKMQHGGSEDEVRKRASQSNKS